jgi:SnoaL-like polyketide cyclase
VTHSPLQAARQFWLELWNERDMNAMLERLDPQYIQRDHRAATPGGASRDDWRALMQSWWEQAPDIAVADFGLAGLQGEYVAYRLRFAGQDGATEFFVGNRVRDGRFLTADIFGSRDLALAWLKNEAYSRS